MVALGAGEVVLEVSGAPDGADVVGYYVADVVGYYVADVVGYYVAATGGVPGRTRCARSGGMGHDPVRPNGHR